MSKNRKQNILVAKGSVSKSDEKLCSDATNSIVEKVLVSLFGTHSSGYVSQTCVLALVQSGQVCTPTKKGTSEQRPS